MNTLRSKTGFALLAGVLAFSLLADARAQLEKLDADADPAHLQQLSEAARAGYMAAAEALSAARRPAAAQAQHPAWATPPGR